MMEDKIQKLLDRDENRLQGPESCNEFSLFFQVFLLLWESEFLLEVKHNLSILGRKVVEVAIKMSLHFDISQTLR